MFFLYTFPAQNLNFHWRWRCDPGYLLKYLLLYQNCNPRFKILTQAWFGLSWGLHCFYRWTRTWLPFPNEYFSIEQNFRTQRENHLVFGDFNKWFWWKYLNRNNVYTKCKKRTPTIKVSWVCFGFFGRIKDIIICFRDLLTLNERKLKFKTLCRGKNCSIKFFIWPNISPKLDLIKNGFLCY